MGIVLNEKMAAEEAPFAYAACDGRSALQERRTPRNATTSTRWRCVT